MRLFTLFILCAVLVGRARPLALPNTPAQRTTATSSSSSSTTPVTTQGLSSSTTEQKATITRDDDLPNKKQSLEMSWRERLDAFLSRLQNPPPSLAQHLYLSGIYEPVREEHLQAPVEVVYGTIPNDLEGLFCRNGPNPVLERMTKLYHWFDGYAMCT